MRLLKAKRQVGRSFEYFEFRCAYTYATQCHSLVSSKKTIVNSFKKQHTHFREKKNQDLYIQDLLFDVMSSYLGCKLVVCMDSKDPCGFRIVSIRAGKSHCHVDHKSRS